MLRKNFPGRKNDRRKSALIRLKDALKVRQKNSEQERSKKWHRRNDRSMERLQEAITNTKNNLP